MSRIIPIGADHAGFELKQKIISYLTEKGYEVKDFGCNSDQSVDYADFAHPVADMVEKNEGTLGILLCGSGNGINMAANKHHGIRSALCWNKEVSALARQHNNANVLTIPARCISEELALEIVDIFFSTEFEGGRHQNRINKISCW